MKPHYFALVAVLSAVIAMLTTLSMEWQANRQHEPVETVESPLF